MQERKVVFLWETQVLLLKHQSIGLMKQLGTILKMSCPSSVSKLRMKTNPFNIQENNLWNSVSTMRQLDHGDRSKKYLDSSALLTVKEYVSTVKRL